MIMFIYMKQYTISIKENIMCQYYTMIVFIYGTIYYFY
jgi:hypothetical protein